jgi:two-component system response regulator RegX3
MDALWGRAVDRSRACDNHITNLRRKIEPDPARPQRLLTVRGVGYKLVAV